MMDDILEACQNGLDVLTVFLLFSGYSQKEVSIMLSTSEPVISRRLKRIRRAMRAE